MRLSILSSKFLLLCFFILPLMLFAEASSPEEGTVSEDIKVLPSGSTFRGDYFAFGSQIEISGIVEGDVYAMGSHIIIDGRVTGDVLALGGAIDVSGEVCNNVRLAGGQITLSGNVGRNATLVAGNAQLIASGTIHGNLVCTAGNVDLACSIGSEATILASNLRLSGEIKKDLSAYVGKMHLTSKTRIGGDVSYTSSEQGWIDAQSKIGGSLIHHPSLMHDFVKGKWMHGILLGSKVAALLMNFLYTFVVGWLLIRLFPTNLDAVLSVLDHHPWKALGSGVMLLFLLPLVSLMLLMTVLGIPFALTLLALNIMGFYTAKVYSIFWASRTFFSRLRIKLRPMLILAVGLICYFLLTAIPLFGTLLALAAMLFGVGAGVLAQWKKGMFRDNL